MTAGIKRALRSAVLRLLAPIVRMLIEAGIGVGELQGLVRISYVRVARQLERERFGDTKPSVTRMQVITGLPRKEIPKLLAADEAEFEPSPLGRQRAEQALAGWHNDSDFQTKTGEPALLPFEGPRRSFTALCERYNDDPRPAAVRDELLRVGAIRQRRDGFLEVLRRDYANARWAPEGIAEMGEQLGEHAATLIYNLQEPERPRYVKRIINARLDRRQLPILLRDLEGSAKVLADRMDNTLNFPEYTADLETPAEQLGIQLYVIQKPVEEHITTAPPPSRAPRTSKVSRARRKAKRK